MKICYDRPKRIRKFTLKNKVCNDNINPWSFSKDILNKNLYEVWAEKFSKNYACGEVND